MGRVFMAERRGFEPPEGFTPRHVSNVVPSTTRPPLQETRELYVFLPVCVNCKNVAMYMRLGGVTERFKVTVLKTVVLKGTASSNLAPTARTISYRTTHLPRVRVSTDRNVSDNKMTP